MDIIGKLNKAFHPSEEIKDPHFFVGRGYEIKASLKALRLPGSFISVWGNRGIGKSSLSRQIANIASGNDTLPTALGLKNLIPQGGFNYLIHYVYCDRSTENVDQLLDRIIFGETNTPSLFSYLKEGDKKLERFERTKKVGGGFKAVGVGIEAGGEETSTYSITRSQSNFQQFKNLLGAIKQQHAKKNGILIFIDEFDLLVNKDGFSSLVKTCSDEYVKFCVAGISSDLKKLLGDHASITRQIQSIKLDAMPAEELALIIEKAEKEIYPIIFESSVKETIIKSSEGLPYFVHLLGYASASEAHDNGSEQVLPEHLQSALESLRRGTLAPVYEELYNAGVKHSSQRELLLRTFADNPNEEICTTDVYDVVKDLGTTNPSQLMKELTAPDGLPPILVQIRDRYYRFQDPIFRTYVKIRNWKFD